MYLYTSPNLLSGRTAPIPSHKGKKLWSAQRFSIRAVNSKVESETFNFVVEGSSPSQLIYTFLRGVVVAQITLNDLGRVRVLVEKYRLLTQR